MCARPPVCGACKAEADTVCEVMKCRRMFVRCSRVCQCDGADDVCRSAMRVRRVQRDRAA